MKTTGRAFVCHCQLQNKRVEQVVNALPIFLKPSAKRGRLGMGQMHLYAAAQTPNLGGDVANKQGNL